MRLALAERQLALFWYDGTGFWLMPAEADGTPQRLPKRPRARPTGGGSGRRAGRLRAVLNSRPDRAADAGPG
jgi:hypothetical protein